MERWLAGKLMKVLGIRTTACQLPAHKYKRGSNEHVEIPNHLNRQFAMTAPDQVLLRYVRPTYLDVAKYTVATWRGGAGLLLASKLVGCVGYVNVSRLSAASKALQMALERRRRATGIHVSNSY